MNASDKELLELAAKAAGYELDFNVPDNAYPWVMTGTKGDEDYGPGFAWNPLSDDGDALRLAVKLSIRVYIYAGLDDDFSVAAFDGGGSGRFDHAGHPYAATRRAIVLAAAEIGRGL